MTHDLLLGEGEYVVARWTGTGNQATEVSGVAPSGKPLTSSGIDIYRIQDGSIVEWWRNDDFGALLHRLSRRVM